MNCTHLKDDYYHETLIKSSYELLKTQEAHRLRFADQEHVILDFATVEALHGEGKYADAIAPMKKIADWSSNYLCRPHSELGRRGAVCPFTKPSIDKGLFWLSMYTEPDPTVAGICEVVAGYKEAFLNLPPQSGREAQYKTILILFPFIKKHECASLIDQVQEQLKPQFVEKKLMLGQFHETCQEGGLWNPDFKVLQSPVPMLVVRNMVVTDFPFLKHQSRFLISYIQNFAQEHPEKVNQYMQELLSGL